MILSGEFSFKFSGFALLQARPFFLNGLGHFKIDDDGHLLGAQQAAVMAIQGLDANFQTAAYTLEGSIKVDNDGRTGSAEILFLKTSGKGKDVEGSFHVQLAENADRFWLISTGAKEHETGEPAYELVNVEAVRVSSQ
jgi:hypothetical protein